MTPEARELILAFADDELMLGHRCSEWIGVGPFLEEDLAFVSIAQDELSHALSLYSLLTDHDPAAVDRLAFGRAPGEYRCAHLVEAACPRWEHALARHLLYDLAEALRWEALSASSLPGLAPIARRALAEEAFHLKHATPLVQRLLAGGDDARSRLLDALNELAPLALGLFEPTEGEAQAVAQKVVAAPAAELAQRWRARVEETLAAAGASLHWPANPAGHGGRRGVRSGDFADLLAEMTKVYALDPSATW
ncbi:MAG: 1,2-phenylacetyl-CoA epoxidase subunit PaaC [Acidimicrobiales bacterium]